MSVQAVILQLLDRLRREEGLGLLFVSHDLNVVRMLCDDLVVLQAGKVMEAGPSREIFRQPRALTIPARCSMPCRTSSRSPSSTSPV